MYAFNYTKNDKFNDTYGNSWYSENCFEASRRIDKVESFVSSVVQASQKPCPAKLFKEFTLIISDICLPSLNIQLNNISYCSQEYRQIGLMLPTVNDTNNCRNQLGNQIYVELFSSELSSSNEVETYADMNVMTHSNMESSTINLLIMIKEETNGTIGFDKLPIEFKFIPLCKKGSIVANFQYITPNGTHQRVATLTLPLNYNKLPFISPNYRRLIKNATYKSFDCSFINEFLKLANTKLLNQTQYNLLIIDDPYPHCLEFNLLWNNTNRHLEIIVLTNGTKITNDYTKFISFSNKTLNHVSFYDGIASLYEFWNDSSICRERTTKRELLPAMLRDFTTTQISFIDGSTFGLIWKIASGIFAVILILLGIGIGRHIFIKIASNKRKTFIKVRAETITSEARIPYNDKNWKMVVDDKHVVINEEEVLGKGSKATVYKAFLKNSNGFRIFSNIKVAAKVATKFETIDMDEFFNELDSLIALKNHPNIIVLKGWTLVDDIPIMLIELAEKDLLTYIKSSDITLGNKIRNNSLQILWQISCALIYISEKNMIHRDIACRNVLLTDKNIAELGDFGLCCTSDINGIYQDSKQKQFPIKWLSIEALTHATFSEKSDVWAFGVLCFEVFSYGELPYALMLKKEIIEFLQNGHRLRKPTDAPDCVYELILNCWETLPSDRLTFNEIYKKIEFMLEYGYLSLEND